MVEIDEERVERTYRSWLETYEAEKRDVHSTLRLLACRFERVREQRDMWWGIAKSVKEELACLKIRDGEEKRRLKKEIGGLKRKLRGKIRGKSG